MLPVRFFRGRPGLVTWVAVNVVLITMSGLSAMVDVRFGQSSTLFAFTVPAAGLCLVTSIAVAFFAHRDDNAELGIFATFFIVVSTLPLVHGLLIPGPLYGPNPASSFTGILALPVALAAGLPLLAPRSAQARAIAHRWRAWAGAWLIVVGAIAGVALAVPTSFPTLDTDNPLVVAMVIGAGFLVLAIGFRHLRLHWLSRSPASLAVAIGFVVLAYSAPGWILGDPFGLSSWWSRVLDVTGVALATIMAAASYRQSTDFRETIRPIVTADPMLALEIGLDPRVHDFVAQLEHKDQITRDHVTRVADLASRVGIDQGLGPDELRDLAIGAVLHDIGKLRIPDAILNKPGRLTSEEYEVVKTHTVIGGDLIAASPGLASAAPIVRGHHERPDGQGYPDGLAGDAIPRAALIVAACDAFDAVANTRQYRDGQGTEVAMGVLQEHAGTQFDPQVVDAVARILAREDIGQVFAAVGKHRESDVYFSSVCVDCERQLTGL